MILSRYSRINQPASPKVDWNNPITRGLILLWSGNNPRDVINGIVESPLTAGVGFQSGCAVGMGFTAGNSTSGGWNSTVLPSSLRPTSVTTFWYGVFNGAPQNANPRILDIAPNQANGSPFNSCGFIRPNQPDIGYVWNNPAYNQVNVTNLVPANGVPCSISMSVTPTGNAKGYFNGLLKVNQSSGGTVAYTNPSIAIGCVPGTNASANTTAVVVAVWSRQLTDFEQESLDGNPWQLFKPAIRRIWKGTAAITSNTGGATETLKPLTETAGAKIGSVAGTVETLKAITESAAGQIPNQGFASETLKALTETAGAKIGSVAGASETLKALTESATGQTTTNNLTGSSADTLKALAETAGAKIGSVGSASDVLKAITVQATGFTPTQIQVAPSAGGAPAWYGYEGFDGTSRPWWYKDLKDKAKELERIKRLRIELGILPKEVKKLTKLIDEIDEFVEETPTPATANYYIAKQEELAERIERLVDQMEEEEDEKAVMNMSKFFFHHEMR